MQSGIAAFVGAYGGAIDDGARDFALSLCCVYGAGELRLRQS